MDETPARHTSMHLGAKRHGVDRIKWPWRAMRYGDVCDIRGDRKWLRHAAGAAGSYISPHDNDMRFRSKTLTDTRGRRYLQVSAVHRLETPLPPLSPAVILDPVRVALTEKIDTLTDMMEEKIAKIVALRDEILELDMAAHEAEHPEAFKRHRHLYRPKTTETRDEAAERIEKARIKMSRKLAGKDDDRGQSEAKKIKAAQALREMNAQYRSNRGEGPADADEDVFADLELPDIIPPRTR
jgi:hypothetical protein